METVVQPPPDAELHLLTEWVDPAERARMGRSAVLSLLVHAAAILFVLVMPETFMQPRHRPAQETVITPLIDPPMALLTQKEPNREKLVREFRSSDLTPRVKAPSGPSPEPQAPAPRKAAATPPPPPKAAPQTPLPEPPKVEIAATEPPKLTLPVQTPQVPQPKTQSPFEDVAPLPQPHSGQVKDLPGPTVADAIHGNLRGSGINVPGTAQVPSTGAELPQLLNDPQGVDFRPYLAHVLAAVKSYWDTVRPLSRRRGDVSVQFAIRRDGTVPKVVFVHQTDDPALDNAVIAAISGGSPFGPLPPAFRGLEIHVQMNFAYNVPKY